LMLGLVTYLASLGGDEMRMASPDEIRQMLA
jgi:hypothetical protein